MMPNKTHEENGETVFVSAEDNFGAEDAMDVLACSGDCRVILV